MNVTHVFAGLPVRDLAVSLDFYERLTGRPPDGRPNETEAVWELVDGGLIYVVVDPVRAGQGLMTMIVEDLEATLTELSARGIASGAATTFDSGARKALVIDPDGNEIGVGAVG